MKTTGKPEVTTLQDSSQRLANALKKAQPAFQALGRQYIDPERFARIIMAAARRPPKREGQKTILDCTTASVILACMEAASLGLEPETPQSHCYLIPYGNVCTLQMGYPGLEALALRDKTIKRIETRLRYAKDVFEPQYAPVVSLKHIPCLDDAPGDVVGVYAISHFADGDIDFEYMTIAQVNAIRDRRSKGANYDSSPWKTDEDEMRRKTVLKRACKRWGKSKELKKALEIDNHEDPKERTLDPEISDFMAELSPPARTMTLPPASSPAPQSEAPKSAPAESHREAKCDGVHSNPPCSDPHCWLTCDPEPR